MLHAWGNNGEGAQTMSKLVCGLSSLMRPLIALLIVAALSSGLAPDIALGAETGSFEISPIGTPKGEGILKIEVTVVVDGKKVTKEVTIPKGAIKAYETPKREPGDTDDEYAQKLADAHAKASQEKAQVIADHINAAFKDEFAKLGEKVETGIKVEARTVNVGGIPKVVQIPYGALIIPGVSKEQGSPIKVTENKILGEGPNKGRFLPKAKLGAGRAGDRDRGHRPGPARGAVGRRNRSR
jgi:hypothetical protein